MEFKKHLTREIYHYYILSQLNAITEGSATYTQG